MLHLKESTSTHWLQALSTQLNFTPCQKKPQVLSCKPGLVSICNCWRISPSNPRIHNSIFAQCLRWGNQTTKRLQLRQLVIINHYNRSQHISNRAKVFQFLVACNLKGVPHGPSNFMCTETMQSSEVLNMTKDQSRCQIIITVLKNLQNYLI